MRVGNNQTYRRKKLVIVGNNNKVYGDECDISGNNNKIYGRRCHVVGNNNQSKHWCSMIGNNNRHMGTRNAEAAFCSNDDYNISVRSVGRNATNVIGRGGFCSMGISSGRGRSVRHCVNSSLSLSGDTLVVNGKHIEWPKEHFRVCDVIDGRVIIDNETYYDTNNPKGEYWQNRHVRSEIEAQQREIERLKRKLREEKEARDIEQAIRESKTEELTKRKRTCEATKEEEKKTLKQRKKGKVDEEKKEKEDEEKESETKGKCVVCQEVESEMLFPVCGHVCMCEECSIAYEKRSCPICRAESVPRKIFIS